MTIKTVTDRKDKEPQTESGFVLKWGKFAIRITAIGSTITGAFAALFSSSTFTSGVALTAAGASTLAAAEKLPSKPYIKTKHVSPAPTPLAQRRVLGSDILPKPEKISMKNSSVSAQPRISRPATFTRPR